MQLAGLKKYELVSVAAWRRPGGFATLLVTEGFAVTFAHDPRHRVPKAYISLEVEPKGAAFVAEWLVDLSNQDSKDAAGLETVTKQHLGKPQVRRGTIDL